MKHIFSFLTALLLAPLATQVFAPDFKDNFTDPKLKERRAGRGDWKIADGIARCTQDAEIYKKNKDHGPILLYSVPTQDSTVHFSFRAQGCKAIAFTMDGAKGHVFRVFIADTITGIRVWPGGSIGQTAKPLGKDDPTKLVQGEWTEVTVEVRGSKVTLKIGKDYTKTVEDPYIAVAKTNIMIGFSFGTLEVKEFTVEG